MHLERGNEPNGLICPGCGNLEHMPVVIVFDEVLSVSACDNCVGKLHALLDEAKKEPCWGVEYVGL